MNGRRLAPPRAVVWITQTLEDSQFETWAVGGAVRDALIGRASGDWDITTRATPSEVRRLFRRTVPIGIEHGTIGVIARDGVMYEVTTFRRDVETDGRHAVVAFADTLDEDLGRRDFTINAIAWHPLTDTFADPFDGVSDLEQGTVRTVGSPNERFREDYLRILRGFRFAGRFDFDIHEDTWSASCDLASQLTSLSPERIREELLKILATHARPSRALELYRTSGAVGVLFPELERLSVTEPKSALGEPSVEWNDALATVDALPLGRPHLRLAGLLRGMSSDESAAILVRLKLSNIATDAVARLAAASPLPGADETDADVRRWLSSLGADRMTPVARLDLARARTQARAEPRPAAVIESWRRVRAILRGAPPLTVGALRIDGRGLRALGLKPGPMFGEILGQLLEEVLEDPLLNEPLTLERRVAEISAQYRSHG